MLAAVSAVMTTLVELWKDQGPADERLQKLELSRAEWEAEMNALLLKADSTLKSAANAESRARTMMRHAEKHADPFIEEGDEVQNGVPPEHAQVGGEEGLQPMRMDVAPLNEKELRLRMKFG